MFSMQIMEKGYLNFLKNIKFQIFFWKDIFAVLGEKRPKYRWLLIGPMRSGTNFHIDPNGTSAWNALLHGRKRWALYPPHYPPPGVKYQINQQGLILGFQSPSPMKWFFEIYPTLSPEQKPIEFTQLPGEMVYIPAGWWHCVLNLEETVSVTQNFINDNNLDLCIDYLYNKEDKKILDYLQSKVKEVIPDVYKKIKTKTKILESKTNELKMKYLEYQQKKKRRTMGNREKRLIISPQRT